MKVLVIGLGTVGQPTATYLSQFYDVHGFDKKIHRKVPAVDPDVYVLCVPADQVRTVCRHVVDPSKLVLIESTMQIGSCRKIAREFSLQLLAHYPHRFWSEQPLNHGVQQFRVLGALNAASMNAAIHFYLRAELAFRAVSSLEVAEASKLIENAHRFVNISFAEEIKQLCDHLGLKFEEIRSACNTKWNCEILEARDGIKGSCLLKDTGLLAGEYDEAWLLKAAIEVDKEYKRCHGK